MSPRVWTRARWTKWLTLAVICSAHLMPVLFPAPAMAEVPPDAPGDPEPPQPAEPDSTDDIPLPAEPLEDQSSQIHPMDPEEVQPTAETEKAEAEENLDIRHIVVEEVPGFDDDRHWVTFGFAYLQNSGSFFAAGGARYALTLLQRPLHFRKTLQDSLAVEGGIYLYKALNFAAQSDSYLIYTTIGTLRYNLLFSEDFGLFLYGGLLKHFPSGTSLQSTQEGLDQLSGTVVAMGGGFLLRIGPSWHLRFDLGTDIGAAGLVLRF